MGTEKFIADNIASKVKLLQDEHKQLLKELNKNYEEINKIKNATQYFGYSELLKQMEKNMEETVLIICLNDLEALGFIINVVKSNNLENAYAISKLGMLAVEKF